MHLVFKPINFVTTTMLILCVIIVISACNHIYNYDLPKPNLNRRCDFNLQLLYVWMKGRRKVNMYYPLLIIHPLMDENLVTLTTPFILFANYTLVVLIVQQITQVRVGNK
jgi:hypothetical protein